MHRPPHHDELTSRIKHIDVPRIDSAGKKCVPHAHVPAPVAAKQVLIRRVGDAPFACSVAEVDERGFGEISVRGQDLSAFGWSCTGGVFRVDVLVFVDSSS